MWDAKRSVVRLVWDVKRRDGPIPGWPELWEHRGEISTSDRDCGFFDPDFGCLVGLVESTRSEGLDMELGR